MARLWPTVALAAFFWSFVVLGDPSIAMNYCASMNTGSTSANHSIYQSDGLCRDFCRDQTFKLAIIQGDSCWCSNSLPDKKVQVSPSECNTPCPGFPSDVCGGPGLYGYMIADVSGGRPTPSPSPSPSDNDDQGTVDVPSETPPPPPPPPPSTSFSSSTLRTASSSTEKSTPAPTPTIQTVTADGSVMTVTVMPSNTNAIGNAPNQAEITSQRSGLGTGAAVGIAVGVIAIVIAAAAVAFCVWRRRKQREAETAMFHHSSPRGSSAGMMSTPRMTEASGTPPFLGRIGDGTWESEGSGRRRSTLMPIDPRIDPTHTGIYSRNDNKSHDSVNTLRDDQDYSRKVHQPPKVLRVTNPEFLDE